VVTEADVLAGKVVNEATATGTSPDPDKPDVPVDPGTDEEPTEEKNAKLTVTKETTSTPADDAYILDEEITYKVTATNNGNVTLTNVVITDELTGDEWTIASLAPGESQSFEASYIVTTDDVVAGSVKNVAKATAIDPENKPVEAQGEVEDATMKRDGNDITEEPGDDNETLDVASQSITVVYDGQAHTLTATATVAGSTILYSTDGGATWTETAPSRIVVGTTEFSIKATHPAYNDVTKDGYTLTVLPKDITITIDDAQKYVGEEDPEFTYTVDGLVNGETIPADLISLFRDEGEEVGTYPIHGKIATKSLAKRLSLKVVSAYVRDLANAKTTFDVSNYNITFVEGTFTILEKPDTSFSLLWVSDLLLKGEGANDDAFKAIIEYANKHAGSLGAVAMVSTGNVVDSFDNEAAWTSAKDSLKALRYTPFLGVAGTKDVNGDEMKYDQYLAAELNAKTETFEDGSVWYRSLGDKNLLLVGIGYQKIAETDEEKERQDRWLEFVNNAISANKNKKVVLIVNDCMDAAGELTEFGKLIEETIIRENENVCMVLCGNANGAAHKELTYGERKVAAVMFNYAADEENGLGLVRCITFRPDNTVTFETIDAIEGEPRAYDPLKPEEDSFSFEHLF
jgi:hypothetical protein